MAIPYLQELSTATGETSFLGVYNNGDIVYLYKAEGTGSIRIRRLPGSRRAGILHRAGQGHPGQSAVEEADRVLENKLVRFTERTVVKRVKLNDEFAKARNDGYAVDDEGIEYGLYCLAVPLYNYTGAVVGAISVSGPSKRMLEQWNSTIVALKHAGDVISRRLGYVKSALGPASTARGRDAAVGVTPAPRAP